MYKSFMMYNYEEKVITLFSSACIKISRYSQFSFFIDFFKVQKFIKSQ
jgi:hypothetical protein